MVRYTMVPRCKEGLRAGETPCFTYSFLLWLTLQPPNPTPSPQESEEEKQFRALFEQISGKDMEVAAEELEYVLNAVLKNTKDIKFKKLSLISCRNIISLMDTSGNGKLEFSEFKVFWEKLKKWINIFLRFDFDKSGSMSSYELRSALKAAGY